MINQPPSLRDDERAWRNHLYEWWALYVRSGDYPEHLLNTVEGNEKRGTATAVDR